MDTPNHFDLWMRHSRGEVPVDAVIDAMARDGFNATTDMPACYVHADLLARWPNARVVLGVRRSGATWARSVRGTIGRNFNVMGRVPYRWVPFIQEFYDFNKWLWARSGLDYGNAAHFDPATKLPRLDALARAHDAWIEAVKAAVPAEKLLVFQPSDGWAPLCAFVSPVDRAVARACAAVLASGDPYPHVNDSAMVKTVYAVMIAVSWATLLAPAWGLALAYACCRRRGRKEAGKAKAA